MTNKPTWRLIGILCSVMLLLFVWPALAQTPTPPPTPREALIEAIQARAQRDVELAKPVEGVAALEVLFGAEAANVGLSMVEVLGVYEEAYTAATPVKPWWEDLRPQAGWIAAIILFVLVIFRDALKDSLSKAVKWLLERIYLRLAGFRPFWRLALERYRRRLVERYERLIIPFRPGRPLEMHEVYVPLKVSGAQTADLIDAYRAAAEYKWLMITGAPGAGKTMLLRHLALHYAEGDLTDFPTQPVPVLLELNRLSESEEPLETHLAQALKANDFPGGERFISAGLEHGLLLLLFDGLDEVARDARPRVVRQIKDLLQAHPKVRAIITCRTAVYDGEFDDLVQQRLEIAEFSDQQIQRFLGSWQAQMPAGKSPEHLLHNLRERPHIMSLARNPLLLTIIAYLYTDTPFVLPHSRAAFYDKALAVLLEQWDAARGTPNRYTVDEKRLVLQHLALYFQDHAARGGRDRRSVDLPTVLAEIARVLPALSRKAEDTRPLLDEIVARSGLLLALEGGLRYQFAHLTLQEFFTAQKLQDDTIGLMERFRADPDAWRETLKLWCGLPHESTVLIRALYAEHPILAFECLSDAQQVDEGLAQEIIIAFQARLGEDGATGEAVTRAFATVATNPQACGQRVLKFLTTTVKNNTTTQAQRQAAAQALAASNLPQAAAELAACAQFYPYARSLLTQMGDLATSGLTRWSHKGHKWAFDALQTIGTPEAMRVLVDFLWIGNDTQSYEAAWRLGALLSDPGIEMTLREFVLTEEQRKAVYLDWIWEPFEPDPASPMRIIVGRIAYLLCKSPSAKGLVPQDLPPRLLFALCIATSTNQGKPLERERREQLEKQWSSASESALPIAPDSTVETVAITLNEVQQNKTWERFFYGLPHVVQSEWLRRLAQGARLPDKDDWRNLYHPSQYDFAQSWHVRGWKTLLMLIVVLNLCYLGRTFAGSARLWTWHNILAMVGGVCLVVASISMTLARWTLNSVEVFFAGIWLSSILANSEISGDWKIGAILGAASCIFLITLHGTKSDVFLNTLIGVLSGGLLGGLIGRLSIAVGTVVGCAMVGAIVGIPGGGLSSMVLFLVLGVVFATVVRGTSVLVHVYWGVWGLIFFWSSWFALTLVVYWIAKHRQRVAENPLHGLLPDVRPSSETSLPQVWNSSQFQIPSLHLLRDKLNLQKRTS